MSRSFRHGYLSYEDLTAVVQAWARDYPAFVRLQSIGQSEQHRELWLLTVGRDPDRVRPGVWVDGNMHATELAGSSVALGIAEDMITLHREGTVHGLPAPAVEALRDVVFYILPRMCPDGAESVIRHGGYVRSNPRDHRKHAPTPRWIHGDVDGDGLSLVMRKQDPTGEFVESTDFPNVMLPRGIEDTGPFYKVYPEGTIEGFDGSTIPDPYYLSDNETDMNRNFPYHWQPEHVQAGAGRFPMSEPESRAVVAFTADRPWLFAWLNLHTFGGVYIRPLGTAPDTRMEARDLALFRQVAAWGETYGGYPTVSGYEEFTYEPDKPLHGDLTEYAYNQLGVIAYVCELWDLFRVVGMDKQKRFVDHYSHMTPEDLMRFARWDRDHNSGRVFLPWRPVTHPQLGPVEVGGFDMRVGLSNPSFEALDDVCQRQSRAFLRVASLAPRMVIHPVATTALGDGTYRVELDVENTGYLPTWVLDSARKLSQDVRVYVEAMGDGVRVVGDPRACAGDLDGWGRGLHNHSIFMVRSRGSASRKRVAFVVQGRGMLTVRAHGLRVGAVDVTVSVG